MVREPVRTSLFPKFLKTLIVNQTQCGSKLTKLLNLIGEGEKPEQLRPFFFGEKLIALVIIGGGLRSIVIGNTLRRIASKCAGRKALAERQFFFGSFQVGCGTKRGAEMMYTPLEI